MTNSDVLSIGGEASIELIWLQDYKHFQNYHFRAKIKHDCQNRSFAMVEIDWGQKLKAALQQMWPVYVSFCVQDDIFDQITYQQHKNLRDDNFLQIAQLLQNMSWAVASAWFFKSWRWDCHLFSYAITEALILSFNAYHELTSYVSLLSLRPFYWNVSMIGLHCMYQVSSTSR